MFKDCLTKFTSCVQSGARINISDASCPERIVTISGTTPQIVDAFSMISRRFEEVTGFDYCHSVSPYTGDDIFAGGICSRVGIKTCAC